MNDAEARSPQTPAVRDGAAAPSKPDQPSQDEAAGEQRRSFLSWGAETLRRLTEIRKPGTSSLRQNLQDELAREADASASFTPEERVLLSNILRLREVRVEDVMVPRADIDAVEDTVPLGRLMEVFQESGHSRMPVYHDGLDDPRGMVHIKDLMAYFSARAAEARPAEDTAGGTDADATAPDASAAPQERSGNGGHGNGHGSGNGNGNGNGSNRIATLDLSCVDLTLPLSETDLIRSVLFVPPSMPATDLMAKMQADRVQMALVIDEYGGTDGLVSLEDVVETVVGDIEDEHDEDEAAMLERVADGVWVADPRVPVEEVEEALGTDFELGDLGEEVDTLGGLVFSLVGRVPVRGELITARDLPGFEFEVLDADPRRIRRLRIRRKRSDPRLADARRRLRRPDATG
ncbi:hemolysin family protein [Stappia sp.]|uniref:hemolysin family protein n=1 Tax=Stappia sp. TaxID=1870903 RepID=UPI0032D8BAE4